MATLALSRAQGMHGSVRPREWLAGVLFVVALAPMVPSRVR
jgi:hypothetical protein